ncbi:MAG: peptidase S51 [Dechloromonas sp.]|nr:MAG: peptidase S51 [Dechloromonas sp.]
MKLALYSNQTIAETDSITSKLLARIGRTSPRIGYISSAPDPQRTFYDSISAYYRHFGGSIGSYNDLEDGYNPTTLGDAFDSDALHLTGGNTFRFLNWIQKRSMKERLIEYAKGGGTLIGVSAGSIIMTPTIESSALCGDTNEIGLSDMTGLDIFPFQVIPHAHQIEGLDTKAREIVRKKLVPAYCIKDDQALFYDGTKVEIIGGASFYPICSEQNRDNHPPQPFRASAQR